MQQFDLSVWLKDKSRKVTTRYGDRKVRIICTDRKGKRPIVALMVDMDDGSEYITSHSINGWIDDEEKYPDKRDLFFADEKEELTELEKAIYIDICTIVTACDGKVYGDKELKPIVKGFAKDLLGLARKELLEDLPKWKDVSGKNGAGTKDYEIVGYYLVKGNYAIYLEDLDKLPKEE